MDEGNRRSSPPRKAWESQDPLVRKYLQYRSASPIQGDTSEGSSSIDGSLPRGSDASTRRTGSVLLRPERSPRAEPSAAGTDLKSSEGGGTLPAAKLVPDRGLRSRLFSEREGDVPSARSARGPHGIDPSWYAQRPWKSARARILPLLFLLAGAWIALTLVFGTNGVVRLFELKAREKNLQAKLAEVSKEHDALQRELQEPAPLALERSAREKFDLQRPGEIVYRFPRVPAETFAGPDTRASESDAAAEGAAAPDEGAPSRGESKSGN